MDGTKIFIPGIGEIRSGSEVKLRDNRGNNFAGFLSGASDTFVSFIQNNAVHCIKVECIEYLVTPIPRKEPVSEHNGSGTEEDRLDMVESHQGNT